MDPRKLFFDERLAAGCVYCGSTPDTRDHVPSRVLLDEPFPGDLPVVKACSKCNSGFSLNEQYVACLLECMKCNTTIIENLQRDKIKRILSGNPSLRNRLVEAHTKDANDHLWVLETDRIVNVILKLARGHIAYELFPFLHEPKSIYFKLVSDFNDIEKDAFENEPFRSPGIPTEIGTLSNSRIFLVETGLPNDPGPYLLTQYWIDVQEGRYRYCVLDENGFIVRIVLNEFLACEAYWEDSY